MEELIPIFIAIVWFGYKVYKKNTEAPKAGPDPLYETESSIPKNSQLDFFQNVINEFVNQQTKPVVSQPAIVEEDHFSSRFSNSSTTKSNIDTVSTNVKEGIPTTSKSVAYEAVKSAKESADVLDHSTFKGIDKKIAIEPHKINLRQAVIYDVIFRRPNY